MWDSVRVVLLEMKSYRGSGGASGGLIMYSALEA